VIKEKNAEEKKDLKWKDGKSILCRTGGLLGLLGEGKKKHAQRSDNSKGSWTLGKKTGEDGDLYWEKLQAEAQAFALGKRGALGKARKKKEEEEGTSEKSASLWK